MAPALGQHVRLRTLQTADLPPHPAIAPTAGTPIDLFSFIKDVLDEAVAFADEIVPQTFKPGADKTAPPAAAKVKLLSRDIKAAELPEPVREKGRSEAWFARRSVHASKKDTGTADYGEFDFALRIDHSTHEYDYTPEVYDARKVTDWNDLIAAKGGSVDGGYTEVTMSIYEMCHKIPFPCYNRVFCTLVITALTSASSFIVAQLPVDLTDFPDAEVLYANGRNRRDAEPGLKRKKVIVGEYVSVERVTCPTEDEVCWIMATASDAKGWLPMGLQKMGVPSAVVKDVAFVVDWTQKRRAGAA